MPVSGFDPAEMSRLSGFAALLIGGDLDADATDASMSDLRQTMRAAGRLVARVIGAPTS